jgi:hypothetical protein
VKVRNPAGRFADAFVKTNTSKKNFGQGWHPKSFNRSAAIEFTPACAWSFPVGDAAER